MQLFGNKDIDLIKVIILGTKIEFHHNICFQNFYLKLPLEELTKENNSENLMDYH